MTKLDEIEARWKHLMEFGPSYASTGQGNAYEPPEKRLIEEDIPELIAMVRALREGAGSRGCEALDPGRFEDRGEHGFRD